MLESKSVENTSYSITSHIKLALTDSSETYPDSSGKL